MSPPDDLPAGFHPTSEAAPWALSIERREEDRRFDEIIRAVEVGLCKSALPYARRLVGTNDAEDAVSEALEKALKKYDQSRGGFKPFFYIVLRGVCTDMLRERGREPQASAELAWWGELVQAGAFSAAAAVEDEDMQARIAAALEVMKLSDTQRDMLSRAIAMLDGAEADQFAHLTGQQKKRALDNARQQKKRALDKVLERAGVTADERKAANLGRAAGRQRRCAAAAVHARPRPAG